MVCIEHALRHAKDNVLLVLSHLLYDSASMSLIVAPLVSVLCLCVWVCVRKTGTLDPSSECLFVLKSNICCSYPICTILIVFFLYFLVKISLWYTFCPLVLHHYYQFEMCAMCCSTTFHRHKSINGILVGIYFPPPFVVWQNNNNWIRMKYIFDVHFP